ncbi:hypothetical protein VNO78_11596 [Psophocarpus tetragonolobus]|uniref:Legume lectin domain-containing protein n=1 Tax=Psophocarpus tetragonolobus TaxID=3891 RepID=A0AAN9XNU6_PSOTE
MEAMHIQFSNLNFPYNLLLLLLSIFFLFIIPYASSLSFNFPSFDPNDKSIIYEGSANPVAPTIQLTRNQVDKDMIGSVGRATYYQPMHLWDKTTGGSLGLTLANQTLNSTHNPFVAVEFDIFRNGGWDSLNKSEHVGIDINSLRSVADVAWLADIKERKLNETWISYNSSSLNLTVVFTEFKNETIQLQHLSAIVDLRLYLPELVTFGFSAATGTLIAIHKIACGRKPINLKALEKEINIVQWVWELYGEGRILEAADPRLEGDFEEEQMKCLMIVGLWCAHPDHNNRPSIRQAIQVLNLEVPLPNLPSSFPLPTHLEHPLYSSIASFSINASEEGQSQITSASSNKNLSVFTTISDDASPSVSLLYSR